MFELSTKEIGQSSPALPAIVVEGKTDADFARNAMLFDHIAALA